MMTIYYWLTCLFIVFGTGVLCDQKLKKQQTVTACSGKDTFTCSNGLCIDSTLTCDGHADCLDGSDETRPLCTELIKVCPSFAFRCNYGACVEKNAKCNGKKDCVDGSDENLPECKSNFQAIIKPSCNLEEEYSCQSGQCIDITNTCDGVRDCDDGSDETLDLCQTFHCRKDTFKCAYGACVHKSSKCDGIMQCADGSDEECDMYSMISKPMITRPITTTTLKPTTQSNEKITCAIPYKKGSVYSYNDTDNYYNGVLLPGTEINPYLVIKEDCEEGYYKVDSNTYMMCVNTGIWIPSISKKSCLKMCPPMISDSNDIECTRNGQRVNCSNSVLPDTVVKPKCKLTHVLPNGAVEIPIKLLCRQDGTWSGQLYKCVPKCGELFTLSKPLISNGIKAQYGTSPWNVGVYKNDVLICGGTLIAPNLIISAAHCFWEEETREKIIKNNGLYKIAVGKYDRNISVMDNRFTKIIDVDLIYIKDTYLDFTGFYADDIAIVVLPTNVEINIAVLPVCIDWNTRYTVTNGVMGKIVGWGKTENGTVSQYLLETSLPYIDYETCQNRYKNNDFKKFVKYDKFCAGSHLGGALEGDSGAGITYQHGNAHYLTGLVSNKNPDKNDAIALFTDISYHIQWINNFYTNFTR